MDIIKEQQMDLNKLYKKCKNELDRTLRNHQEEYLDLLRNEILYKRIRFYFLDQILNKKIYGRTVFGGDWLLYEWNRYLDEVTADEKMKTFLGLDKTINDLRKYNRHDISTTQLMNILTIDTEADMWKEENVNGFD